MRRKRFKHIAFTVCHMFSGWQLINSYSEIKQIGTGIYQYDFKLNELRVNGKIIKTVKIFEALQLYFNQEVDRMNIDLSSVLEAYIVIDLHYTQVSADQNNKELNDRFFNERKIVDPKMINEITYDCVACIETDERQYNSLYNSSNSWPEGWLED